MYSPELGPTHQHGRRALYPATFRNMAPYEDAYLDQDMPYPILQPPSQDPFADTSNMLSGIVPMPDQVSDGSSPLSNHADSANGCDGEESDDTSPFAKLLTSAEILADNDDDEGSSADDVGIVAKPVQRDIVASMWKGLEPEHKLAYKRKTKVAKMEYRKTIAEYRSRLSMNGAADQLDLSRRSGYMSSPPGAMRTPPRDSMSPLQNSNPLLSSAMDDGSPRDYMDVASPEDVLSTQRQQQRQQLPIALNSVSMFQKQKQVSLIPNHCCPQQVGMNSPRASALCCSSDRKPERSPSLCNQASGCGGGMPNNQYRMPAITFTRCRRSGCPNPPVPSHEWDVEYCSSECVILHCKDVFSGWVAQRQIADRLLPP
ncbi:hypothetical protein MTO96_027952 [Rhipicephalus appendiculatus]